MNRTTIDRAWAAALALTTAATILTTTITPDLWIIDGTPALAFSWLYVTALGACAANPTNTRWHRIAVPAGILHWGGRTITTAALITSGDPRTALWTVAANATAIGTTATALHLLALRAITADRQFHWPPDDH